MRENADRIALGIETVGKTAGRDGYRVGEHFSTGLGDARQGILQLVGTGQVNGRAGAVGGAGLPG